MFQRITAERKYYDTRMYLGITYTNASNGHLAMTPLHLHLIIPRGEEKERYPLLLYVGGGGFRVSKPESHLPELNYFAKRGMVVASIEYRTTANVGFPKQIEDVKTAIRFLRGNARRYQIEPDRIFVMGGSAGAYLAAMAGLTGGSLVLKGTDYPDVDDAVSGAVCLYGLYDLEEIVEKGKGNPTILPIQLFLGDGVKEQAAKASPVNYIGTSGCKKIPFLLLHGTDDSMVPYEQSVLFYEKLIESGYDADLILLEGETHAGETFSQPDIQKRELDFFNQQR